MNLIRVIAPQISRVVFSFLVLWKIDLYQIIHQIIASFDLLGRAEFLAFCEAGFTVGAFLPVIRPRPSLLPADVVPVGTDTTTIFCTTLGQKSEGQSAFLEGSIRDIRDSTEKDVKLTITKPFKAV